MNSYELNDALSEKYPKSLSCEWDNDGIMASCGPVCEVERVLVTLDATEKALQYAAENGFDTLLTHHPMIFSGIKSLTPDDNVARKAIFAVMNCITVMSFHTRLDAADGGVNDALAEALGLCGVEKFGDDECPTMGRIGSVGGCTIGEFFEKVKSVLGERCVLYCDDACETVEKVAVLGGAGKDFVYAAKELGADVFVTGEAGYNFCLDAMENGIAVITAGHFETENVVCKKLAEAVGEIDSNVYVEIFGQNE